MNDFRALWRREATPRASRRPRNLHVFRPAAVETFELRITPSVAHGATGLYPGISITDPALITKPDGSTYITTTVTNTGTSTVVLGFATYTLGPIPYPGLNFLKGQTLIDFSTSAPIAGGQKVTVTKPVELDCYFQDDIFVYKKDGAVVQQPITTFTDLNAYAPDDGGYFNNIVGWMVDTDCPPSMAACLTQGYWKNHPDAWPVSGLFLGGQWYTKDQLIAILKTPPQTGNAVLIAAHQEIAALLNIENGCVPTAAVVSAIQQTNAILATLGPLDPSNMPYVSAGSATGGLLTALGSTMDAYNSSGV